MKFGPSSLLQHFLTPVSQMARYKLSDRLSPNALSQATRLYPLVRLSKLFPRRFAGEEQFWVELEKRLNKIHYPYQPKRAQAKNWLSTREKLKKVGVLDALRQPAVLSSLLECIEYPDYCSRLRQIKSPNTPFGKEFRSFHVALAKELARHVRVIQKLVEAYGPGEKMLGGYLRTAEEQLIIEAAVNQVCLKGKTLSEREAFGLSLQGVYSEVVNALRQKGVKNDSLAHHLTSIICSPNCLTAGVLSPDPEAVRKSLQYRDKTSK